MRFWTLHTHPLSGKAAPSAALRISSKQSRPGVKQRENIHLARISTEITLGIVDSQRQKGAQVKIPMENRSLYLGRW